MSNWKRLFTKIRGLFHRRAKQLENYIESDLEHNFIRPFFDILGNIMKSRRRFMEQHRA